MNQANPEAATAQEWLEFQQFVQQQGSLSASRTLEQWVQRFREVQQLRQALAEIETLPEAAAGCGYSRDEIAAQYHSRLERLMQGE